MDLPENLIDNHVFIPGFAFKKLHSSTSEPEKKRFFFVLNKTPNHDKYLVVSTTTTKIRKYRRKFTKEVIVDIAPEEYDPLTEKCIIVCEYAHVRQKSTVLQWIKKGNIEHIKPLPESVMERIRTAVAKCKILPPEDKRLVLGEEESAL